MPSPLEEGLITWAHTSPATHKTHQLLQGKYWWPQMPQDLHHFISFCSVCIKAKVSRTHCKLLPLPTPLRPWSNLTIDFITDLPASHNNTVIMVIVEWFSKSLLVISLPGLPSAFGMAELLLSHPGGPRFTTRV